MKTNLHSITILNLFSTSRRFCRILHATTVNCSLRAARSKRQHWPRFQQTRCLRRLSGWWWCWSVGTVASGSSQKPRICAKTEFAPAPTRTLLAPAQTLNRYVCCDFGHVFCIQANNHFTLAMVARLQPVRLFARWKFKKFSRGRHALFHRCRLSLG